MTKTSPKSFGGPEGVRGAEGPGSPMVSTQPYIPQARTKIQENCVNGQDAELGYKIAWNLIGTVAVKAGTVGNPVEVLRTQAEGAGGQNNWIPGQVVWQ